MCCRDWGEPGIALSVSPDPAWQPDIPVDEQYTYDPAAANQMLDDAGYADTDGNGIREMPDGGQELTFRYAERSESDTSAPVRELVTGFLSEIGIGTDVSVYDDGQLTDVVASGEYDLFVWGWTPFVDPDPMLSYFTCANLTTDIEAIGYNDANWCSTEYDDMYTAQNQELDRTKRISIVQDMLRLFYDESTYVVLFEDADLQAYRTDRFEGWTKQPADTGPGAVHQHLAHLREPAAIGEGDDTAAPGDTSAPGDTAADGTSVTTGSGSGSSRRRRPRCRGHHRHRGRPGRARAGDRSGDAIEEEPGRARLTDALALRRRQGARVAEHSRVRGGGQLLLFRVVNDDPVETMFRGRNLSDAQKGSAASTVQPRWFEAAAVRRVRARAACTATSGISLQSRRPVTHRDPRGVLADRRPRGHGHHAVDDHRRVDRHPRRVAPAQRVRRVVDHVLDVHLRRARLLVGDAGARRVLGTARSVPLRRHGGRGAPPPPGLAPPARPGAPHGTAVPGAGSRVPGRVRDRDALVDARHGARGLPATRPRQGATRRRRPIAARGAQRAVARGEPVGAQLRVRAVGRDRCRIDLLVGRALGQATLEAIRGPDFPVLQGLFLLFSAALIAANLLVDLLYGKLDPRVGGR